MEQSIEFIIGFSFPIIGLSYLLRTNDWVLWLDDLKNKGRQAALKIGIIHLSLGAFIVSFHWIWIGVPMLTTIIGVLCSFRGFMCLIFPQLMITKLRLMTPYAKPALRITGILSIIIGLIILRGWVQSYGIENLKQIEEFIINKGNIG